jgi:hypothetical protein
MKKIFQILFKIQVFYTCILAGSWLGAQLRPLVGAAPSQGGMFKMQDEQGHNYQSVPIITHMLPGLVLALLAKPRWLMALLGSLSASLLLGDAYERRLLENLANRLEGKVQQGASE